jgi:TonB C terminal
MVRGTIAASICLLAHAFIYETAMWSAGTRDIAPRDLPARIGVTSESDQESLQWIALDPQALADASQPRPDPPASHLTHIDVHKALEEIALLIPDVDLPPTSDATVADAARLSKMYGRYVGQVSARIERAWMRPRTAIGAQSFYCQVRVGQDALGNVTEVTLENCNGDVRWQLSLVHAIQSASPLPAPPDPDVFSRTLRLAFSGEAYSPQSPPDQYESQASAQIVQASLDAQRADDVLESFGDSGSSRTIRLDITGDRKTVEVQKNTTAEDEPTSPQER